MARLARIVIPGVPHHVTQRGNRREQVFFGDADYALYGKLLSAAAAKAGAEIWAYCFMPNHVHAVIVPQNADGLRATFADTHRRYTAHINARNRWTGHLWQGRFGSVAMDDPHVAAAVRYVTLNPVRAGLVKRPEEWRWSSARAHIAGKDDGIVRVAPVIERVGGFAAFLGSDFDEDADYAALRMAETSGRPVGSADWLDAMGARMGRTLKPGKRGRKPGN